MLGAGMHLLEMINSRPRPISDRGRAASKFMRPRLTCTSVVAACLDLVRPTAEAKGLALRLVTAADVPRHVMSDPTRLRQMLLNLLGNAVKFTTAGSVCAVPCGLQRLRRLAVRLEVADTGPGISPADRRRQLFQDFREA